MMMRRGIALAIGLIALAALRVFCIEPWRCNGIEGEAESMLAKIDTAPDSFRSAMRIRRISEVVGQCLKGAPHDVHLLLEHAACDMTQHKPAEALTHYQEALRYDRRPEIYLGLGLAQWELGQKNAAVATFGRAYAFATYQINYDQSLPWSGERMVDQMPPGLERSINVEAERVVKELEQR